MGFKPAVPAAGEPAVAAAGEAVVAQFSFSAHHFNHCLYRLDVPIEDDQAELAQMSDKEVR